MNKNFSLWTSFVRRKAKRRERRRAYFIAGVILRAWRQKRGCKRLSRGHEKGAQREEGCSSGRTAGRGSRGLTTRSEYDQEVAGKWAEKRGSQNAKGARLESPKQTFCQIRMRPRYEVGFRLFGYIPRKRSKALKLLGCLYRYMFDRNDPVHQRARFISLSQRFYALLSINRDPEVTKEKRAFAFSSSCTQPPPFTVGLIVEFASSLRATQKIYNPLTHAYIQIYLSTVLNIYTCTNFRTF